MLLRASFLRIYTHPILIYLCTIFTTENIYDIRLIAAIFTTIKITIVGLTYRRDVIAIKGNYIFPILLHRRPTWMSINSLACPEFAACVTHRRLLAKIAVSCHGRLWKRVPLTVEDQTVYLFFFTPIDSLKIRIRIGIYVYVFCRNYLSGFRFA